MTIPIRQLRKADIEWLATHTCKAHRHNFLDHYVCFLKEKPDTAPFRERVGFFDIETTGLKADYHHVLSYAIRADDGKLYGRVLTPEEIRGGTFDKKLLKELCMDLKRFQRVVVHYGCLTPGHRVLTKQLDWIPVENLKPGDELVAFKEFDGSKRWRYANATVLANKPIIKECHELKLSDGTILTASADHPFLRRNGAGRYIWTTPREIQPWFASKKSRYGHVHFNRVLSPWNNSSDDAYKLGYLAGVLQVENALLSTALSYLREHGYTVTISGGVAKIIECLGRTKPKRLMAKFDPDLLGRFGSREKNLYLESIRPIGRRRVCGLSTSTGTYIAEGFLCHNSDYRFDLPFVRSRAIKFGYDFPLYKDIFVTDTQPILKAKFCLSSNRLAAACRHFGIPAKQHPLDADTWQYAGIGRKKALKIVWVHNVEDVDSTRALFNKIEPYVLKGRRSI